MNKFPRGINKIIEEYCCYQPPFIKELCKETLCILNLTNDLWFYDKYYTIINPKFKFFSNRYKIIRNHAWEVGFQE